MGHTNITPNYSLPQFIDSDKPAWLDDVNQAYSAIDTALKTNADAITKTAGDIPDVSKINDDIATLKASDSLLQEQVTAVNKNVALQDAKITTANNNADTALDLASGLDARLVRDVQDITIPFESWVGDTEFATQGYGLSATVTIANVSADDTVNIIPDDELHGLLYYRAKTQNGNIKVYASTKPSASSKLLLVSIRKVYTGA